MACSLIMAPGDELAVCQAGYGLDCSLTPDKLGPRNPTGGAPVLGGVHMGAGNGEVALLRGAHA